MGWGHPAPTSSTRQHLQVWRKPEGRWQVPQAGSAAGADRLGFSRRGRASNIILTLMAPPSPWELLGGLSPAEISLRLAGQQRKPAALVWQLRPLLHRIITCTREAPGSAHLQMAQALPSHGQEWLSLPDRVPWLWGFPRLPHSALHRRGPAKPQPLLPVPFIFLRLQGCFLPAFLCSWERPAQALPFQREKPGVA